MAGESGEGLLSRGFAELQRRAFERWEKQPWTPWDSDFVVEMWSFPIIYETNWMSRINSGDLRGFQTFSMTSLRQFQGLLKRTGLKLSAA